MNHLDNDAEFIHRIIEGDANAFEYLLTKYKNYVFKIVSRHIPYNQVEETAQDVFIKVYQSVPSFKQKSSFKHWLSAIAVRTCYDFWRKAYKNREVPISSLSENHKDWLENVISEQSSESFYEQGMQAEAKEALDYALNQLSPEDRMIVELIYLEERSGKEAAELLGWSLANVKVRAFRSRKKLYEILSNLILNKTSVKKS